MPKEPIDTPAEVDIRFLGYRLEVIGHWAPSPRKVAAAEAISQRLTSIARCALVRPDIADLLHLSCQLLDGFFVTDNGVPAEEAGYAQNNSWPVTAEAISRS
jgi:hypothetical protein